MNNFTKEDIFALKKLAQDHLFHKSITEGYQYRNRFETYDDAYNNLKRMGFADKEIINRIGKDNNANQKETAEVKDE